MSYPAPCNHPLRRRLSDPEAGFTMIELIVVIVILVNWQ